MVWYLANAVKTEFTFKMFLMILAAAVITALVVLAVVYLIVLPKKRKKRWENRPFQVLFIGNSHTYKNEMPFIFREKAKQAGRKVDVFMVSHGGWSLKQHLEEHSHEAEFNIKTGYFEYVVLQEHTHPFEEEKVYRESIKKFAEAVRAAGAVPVIYATWAKKDEPSAAPVIEAIQRNAANDFGCLYAPVGDEWRKHIEADPAVDLYADDRRHANVHGSTLAAEVLWKVIGDDANTNPRWKQYRKNLRQEKKAQKEAAERIRKQN